MNKNIILAAAMAGSAFAATPAAAQAVASSGPRVELIAGYEGVDYQSSFGDNIAIEKSGFLYGVGAGYDFSLGSVALGVDVEASRTTGEENFEFRDGVETIRGVIEEERDLYLGGRISVPVGTSFVLYGKAGYTDRTDQFETTIDDGESVVTAIDDFSSDGYRLGAGGRLNVVGNLYSGGEYRYSNYDDISENVHQLVGTVGIQF